MGVSPFQALEEGGWHISTDACPDAALDKQRALEWALHNDLRKVGLPSLPKDINRVDTKLRGPLILQVVDVRDVSVSSGASAGSGSSGRSRLLRIRLTDGHTTATAMEFKPLPNVTVDLVPGSKVSLGDVVVKMGVILLKPGSLTVVGGEVEELAQTWEMERKYGALARATGVGVQGDAQGGGPPPFKGVHGSKQGAKDSASKNPHASVPAASHGGSIAAAGQNPGLTAPMGRREGGPSGPASGGQGQKLGAHTSAPGALIQADAAKGRAAAVAAALALAGGSQGQAQAMPGGMVGATAAAPPASGATSTVSLAASLPILNKGAAQKLLEHRNPSPERSFRGRGGRRGRGRGRFRDDDDGDDGSMTLEEYEAMKAAKSSGAQIVKGPGSSERMSQIESDHELALRLQRELDLAEQQFRSHDRGMGANHLLSFTYGPTEEDAGYGGDNYGGRRGRRGMGGHGGPGARGGGRGGGAGVGVGGAIRDG
eukprot:jgi/Mesvir1/2844/Mv13931-RA.1